MPKVGGIEFPKVITVKTPGAMDLEIYDSKTGEVYTQSYAISAWYCRTKVAICQKVEHLGKGMLKTGPQEHKYFPNAKLRLKKDERGNS